MKFIWPCWLVVHDWHHDKNYIANYPAFKRTCGRMHWYEGRRNSRRWNGNVHVQREVR